MKREILGICAGLALLVGDGYAKTNPQAPIPGAPLPQLAERLAAEAPAWQPQRGENGVLSAANASQGFRVQFSDRGVLIDGADGEVVLGLSSMSRGKTVLDFGVVDPVLEEGRIVYRHRDGVTHWLVNSPVGLEQVVSIAERPAGTGELHLGLSLSGNLIPQMRGEELAFIDEAGVVRLRYGKLLAVDAKGRKLASRMELEGERLTLAVNDAEATYPLHIDPLFSAESILTDTAGAVASAEDYGYAVAIDGNTVAVGAPLADTKVASDVGAVFVYERQADGSWSEQVLWGSDISDRKFGASLALFRDWLVVGAPASNADAGRIKFYRQQADGSWSLHSTVTPSDVQSGDAFGSAVAFVTTSASYTNPFTGLDETYTQVTAVAGAPFEDGGAGDPLTSAGAVYVFQNSYDGSWNETAMRGDAGGQNLGDAVAMDGTQVIAGAPGANQARIYTLQAAGTWFDGTVTETVLSAPQTESLIKFGDAVAIDKDLAVVGAPYQDIKSGDTVLISNTGAIDVYERQADGSWFNSSKLNGQRTSDRFGETLSLGKKALVVGAAGQDGAAGNLSAAGAGYIYTRDSNNKFLLSKTLYAPDAAAGMAYGFSTGISTDSIVIGTEAGNAAYAIQSEVDLALVKQDRVDPVPPNSDLSYELIVTNNDTEVDATGVIITDTLPAEVSYVSGDNCSESGGIVTCDVGTLTKGGSVSTTMVYTQTGASAGVVTNTASVSADQPVLDRPSASDSEDTTVNTPPVAHDETATIAEDSLPVGFALTASDVDGDSLTYTVTTMPANGSLSVSESSAQYTPDKDFNGEDSFIFTVSDGKQSDTGSVSITVTAKNDPPVADTPSLTTSEDTELSVTLSASDVDGDTLSYSVTSSPSHGTLTGTAPELIYVPDANYAGNDVFTFEVTDNIAVRTGFVEIAITAVNDAPVANTQTVTTDENTDVAITLSGSDVDGDALTYSVNANPLHGALSGTAPNLTYTPEPGYFGTDTFSFLVADEQANDTATVSITINEVNEAPVPEVLTVTTEEDTPASITLSATDADGDSLTYSVTSTPAHGAVTGTAPNLTYTPDADYSGSDSFTFVVDDGNANVTGTVNITVSAVNDAPVADAQAVSVDEDSSATFTLSGSDIEGDALSYRIVSEPVHGSVALSGDTATYTPHGDYSGSDSLTFEVSDGTGSDQAVVDITVNPLNDPPVAIDLVFATAEDTAVNVTLTAEDIDGDSLSYVAGTPGNGALSGTAPNLSYTPEAGFSGIDSFTFQVSDGVSSASGTVSINVSSVNNPPVITANPVVTDEDTASSVALMVNDADGDALSYQVTTAPTHGSLSGTLPNIAYVPNADYSGSDSFTVTVTDGAAEASAIVGVTVNAVNDAPVATGASLSTDKDTPVSFVLGGSDVDSSTLTFSVVEAPVYGTLSGNAPELTYMPNSGFSGEDSFSFKVSDGQAESLATVIIAVNGVNSAPVAEPLTLAVEAGASVTLNLSGSDADGDSLSYTVVQAPAHGALTGTEPALTYTANADYSGEDSFTYSVSDGQAESAPQTVTITVSAPTAPVAEESGGGGGGGGAIGPLALLLWPAWRLGRRRRRQEL